MIGIFASSKDDIKFLIEKSQIIKTVAFGKSLMMEAVLAGQKVLFVITGYNKINLGIAAGYVGANYLLDSIIGLGNCGYLGNCDMKIGDLALGVSSVQYSVDSSAIGFPKTVIPDVGRGVFCSDPQLVQLAKYACKEIGYQYLDGRIATGEKFIANEKERDFIAKNYCCQFIDMECGGAGEVAFVMNIPIMFIKGISNYANNNASVDFEKYANFANQRACNAALSMLKNMSSQFRF
jgi:adenosylhomocysteine nucleosidase